MLKKQTRLRNAFGLRKMIIAGMIVGMLLMTNSFVTESKAENILNEEKPIGDKVTTNNNLSSETIENITVIPNNKSNELGNEDSKIICANNGSNKTKHFTDLATVAFNSSKDFKKAPLIISKYNATVIYSSERHNAVSVKINNTDVERFIENIQKENSVLRAEKTYPLEHCMEPNDPRYMSGQQWNMARIKANYAWGTELGNDGVIIENFEKLPSFFNR